MLHCPDPNCLYHYGQGNVLDEADRFCPLDGQKLEMHVPPYYQCGQCGHVSNQGLYCTRCGTSLEQAVRLSPEAAQAVLAAQE